MGLARALVRPAVTRLTGVPRERRARQGILLGAARGAHRLAARGAHRLIPALRAAGCAGPCCPTRPSRPAGPCCPAWPAVGLLPRTRFGAVLRLRGTPSGPAAAANGGGVRRDRRGHHVRGVRSRCGARPARPVARRPARARIARGLRGPRGRGQRLVRGQVAPELIVGNAIDLVGAGPRIVVIVLPGAALPQLRLLDLRDPPSPAGRAVTGFAGVVGREVRARGG